MLFCFICDIWLTIILNSENILKNKCIWSFSGLQAKIKEHKELVAQLQREKDVRRIKVSEAVADIQQVNIGKYR